MAVTRKAAAIATATATATNSNLAGIEDSAAMTEGIRVAIRVPAFYPEQPSVWFNQIEAQFVLNGVTSDHIKFYYIMSQLEPKYALEVQDIFDNPPETDKYETLKRELIHRLSASQTQRIRQLLEQEEIGDRTPSQFLRYMRNLAGTTVSEDFLRTLWSGRLPAMTRAIVTAQTDLPLSKLAEIADQISVGTARTEVASVSQESGMDIILKKIANLELQIAELSRSRPNNRFRNKSRQRSRSRSVKRGKSPAGHKVCWYHRKFGKDSTRCRAPCSFVSGNE